MKPPTPSDTEVKNQLRHMLSAKRFKNAPSRSRFLALVVKYALQGKLISEDVVGKALLGRKFKKDESTDVRVTAKNLRKTLTQYYELEGKDDPVRISLPNPPKDKSISFAANEAYRPHFSYHPLNAVNFQYKIAEVLYSQNSLHSTSAAIQNFVGVLDLAPEHLGAALGSVEAWCSLIYWLRDSDDGGWLEKISAEAATLLERIRSRATHLWRFHAVFGYLFLEMNQLELAKQEFLQALSINRVNTESYPPYLRFLARFGERELGSRLAQRYIETNLGERQAYIEFADILICVGCVDEAITMLGIAHQMFGDFGLLHHRLFLIRLTQKRFQEAIAHQDWMRSLLDPVACEASLNTARKVVDSWPEEDRKELKRLATIQDQRDKAISRVLKASKA